MEDINTNKITKRTPYNVLNINIVKELFNKDDEEKDAIILEKKEYLLKICTDMLKKTNTNNFRKKTRIELEIQRINEAYELIKTAEKREKYDLKLQQEKEAEIEKIRQMRIKDMYSHETEFDMKLISDNKEQKCKNVIRKDIESEEYQYLDMQNRNLRIKQTGRIAYQNSEGIFSTIDEYLVTRTIDGVEKSDTIYTNLSIIELSKERNVKKAFNSDYYYCVINKLLAEETIEGSRFNYGYIGEVEKDNNGIYELTLKKKKLKQNEKEQLTAVMIANGENIENAMQIE